MRSAIAAICITLATVIGSSAARATPVIVERGQMREQLKMLADQLAIVQQQLDGSPARGALGPAMQQLHLAQEQVRAIERQLMTAQALGGDDAPPPPPPPPPQQVLSPMGDATLRQLVQQINAAPFSSDKLGVLRQAASGNYFLSRQVARILPLYAHSSDRLDALRVVAPLILDRDQTFILLPQFTFSSDRDAAQQILQSAPPLPPMQPMNQPPSPYRR